MGEQIKEGMVFLQETSDAIEMSMTGETRYINPHTEHWMVKDITKDNYILYNLDTGCTWTVRKDYMKFYLQGSKKFAIKPLLTLSEEVA